LLVSGPAGPKDRTGIWVLPVIGGLRKLQDSAEGAAPSPDGTRIAFHRGTEIWLMNASGEAAHPVLAAPEEYGFSEELAWSPEGRRIAFGRRNRASTEFTIEIYDTETNETGVILSDIQVESFYWAPDGRIIYSRREDGPNQISSNVWEVRMDPRTARPSQKPKRLTNWADFNIACLSIGANGRASFVRDTTGANVYVAGLLDGGSRLATPRRLTFDEWIDWPTAWIRDSKSVLFYSNRNGVLDIFQQALDGNEARPIAGGREDRSDPRMSPDGRWILYLVWAKDGRGNRTGDYKLMRKSIAGTTTEIVLQGTGYAGLAPDEPAYKRSIPFAEGSPRFRCPIDPQSGCVLSEKIQDHIVFTAFDPATGRKRELTRVGIARSLPAFWDLSPDGRWIAFGTSEDAGGRLRLISLAGESLREISVGEWTNLMSVAWAADGRSLFATAWASRNPPLLHVSLDGKVQLLRTGQYYLENPVPSPDGRLLAFGDVRRIANVWVVDNLR
jgi:Tol biopolymer transport system component